MIPWAVYEFFMGDYKMTVALIVIYVITQAVHQLLQPKLVGDSVGLNPLVTLFLLYIGYRMGGILWMIWCSSICARQERSIIFSMM